MRKLSELRICYLAGSLGQGGAERQLYYALRVLRESGTLVRVLSVQRAGFWEDSIRKLGVPVTWVGQDGSRCKRLVRIWRALRHEPTDIFQSQHFFTNAYVSVAAWLRKLPGIGALRSNGLLESLDSGRVGGPVNLHLPRILAANSRAAMRHAFKQGIHQARLYFLPNVVDMDRFRPSATRPEHPVTLLAVGALSPEKRFDRFLEILAKVRACSNVHVRGVIVGPPRGHTDVRTQLEQQAAALKLVGSIEFRGSVTDMPSVYQQASLCVLTSDHEGTPNVLLEAMASGLPVVATKVGGVPDIVRQGKAGFLFEPEDIQGQVAAVHRLITDPQLRTEMGRQAREYVQENHSIHRLSHKLEGLYARALSRTLGGPVAIHPHAQTITSCTSIL